MANAKSLDQEASDNERPQRPARMPAGAPDSPVLPDSAPTDAEKQALEAERRRSDGEGRLPAGGLPEHILHGDRVAAPAPSVLRANCAKADDPGFPYSS